MGTAAITERRWGKSMDLFLFGAPKLAAKLRMRWTAHKVEEFYMNIIRDTVSYGIKNNVKRNDFMGMMIDMKLKYDSGNKKDCITFNELAAQAYIYLLAGIQDIQDKLSAEIDGVLEKNNGKLDYAADDVSE